MPQIGRLKGIVICVAAVASSCVGGRGASDSEAERLTALRALEASNRSLRPLAVRLGEGSLDARSLAEALQVDDTAGGHAAPQDSAGLWLRRVAGFRSDLTTPLEFAMLELPADGGGHPLVRRVRAHRAETLNATNDSSEALRTDLLRFQTSPTGKRLELDADSIPEVRVTVDELRQDPGLARALSGLSIRFLHLSRTLVVATKSTDELLDELEHSR